MKLKNVISTAGLTALVACGSKPQQLPSNLDAEIGYEQPEIGQVYNSYSDEFENSSCVTIPDSVLAVDPPKEGEIFYSTNIEAKDVLDKIGGSASAKLDLDAIDASGSLKIANEASASNYASTLTIIYRLDGGKHYIKNQEISKLALNEYGQRIANANMTQKQKTERCGTGFLSSYALSGSFMATLRFEFANESDKNKFEGKLKIAMAKFEGEGEITTDLREVASKGSVTLKAFQRGGDVTRLPGILSENLTRCDVGNKEACLRAFEQIRQYVTNDFPSQFQYEDGGLNPRSFWFKDPHFTDYRVVSESFDPKVPTPDMLRALTETRKTLNDRFLIELSDKNRVRALLKSGFVKDLEQREQLFDLQEAFDSRLRVVAEALSKCYAIADNSQPCEQAATSYETDLSKHPVDYSLLTVLPESFLDYCAQLSAWFTLQHGPDSNPAQAQLVLANDTIKTLQSLLNVEEVANQIFRGATFDANYTSSATTSNVWGPLSEYYVCPTLDWYVSYIDNTLDLSNQRLRDFEPLASVPFVENLILNGNQYKYGMQTIGKLKYLTRLELKDSFITTLKGINNGILEVLDLSENFIRENQLEYLQNMTLTSLNLKNNKIRKLDGLKNLPFLESLNLVGNPLKAGEIVAFIDAIDSELGSTPQVVFNGRECSKALGEITNNQELLFCI